MTDWQKVQERDPQFFRWLVDQGWTESKYNRLSNPDQTMLRVEFNGGLVKTGILRELPGAIGETVKEQGEAMTLLAQSANTTLRVASVAVAVAGIAFIFHKPILQSLRAVK